MSDPNSDSKVDAGNNKKRSLSSWMSSTKVASKTTAKAGMAIGMWQERVVFVLSGFVNPECGSLRSQGLEMGAVNKPDWTAECTILVCALPNNPKFRQVEANCGTIVSKVVAIFSIL